MALPQAYQTEIQALNRQVTEHRPRDVLQFCADFFSARLAAERTASLLASPAPPKAHEEASSPSRPARPPAEIEPVPGPPETTMSGLFTGPFGANSNPFVGAAEASPGPMQRVLEEEEEEEEIDTVTSPTATHFASPPSNTPASAHSGFRTPFGHDGSLDSPPSAMRSPPNPESYPDKYNFGRRTSVSAESLKPSADTNNNWTPPFHDKTPEQLERLRNAIADNFLFSHLDDEQSAQILGALVEKPIPARDIKIIVQGDAGDFFYIVEKGSFDVYIDDSGSVHAGPGSLGTKVNHIQAGGSFGELALMYNAPRAATVVSAEPACTLWALDRVTFRRILMESTFARRRMYESFLEEVPVLASLTPYERSKIADALETQKFAQGEMIIHEGDPGHSFYLLESGEADAYKTTSTNVVKSYHKGDFFGELALLNDAPRAASVVARSEVKVASLGKSAFQRLLGPVESILRRTKYDSIKTGVEEMDPLQMG